MLEVKFAYSEPAASLVHGQSTPQMMLSQLEHICEHGLTQDLSFGRLSLLLCPLLCCPGGCSCSHYCVLRSQCDWHLLADKALYLHLTRKAQLLVCRQAALQHNWCLTPKFMVHQSCLGRTKMCLGQLHVSMLCLSHASLWLHVCNVSTCAGISEAEPSISLASPFVAYLPLPPTKEMFLPSS